MAIISAQSYLDRYAFDGNRSFRVLLWVGGLCTWIRWVSQIFECESAIDDPLSSREAFTSANFALPSANCPYHFGPRQERPDFIQGLCSP